MPIKGSQIYEGCTPAFTGGTLKTFSETGLKLKDGGVQVADSSVASATTRPTASFNSTPEIYDSKTKEWKSGTRDVVSTRPKVLVSGVQIFPSIRVRGTNFHPEMTVAEVWALRVQTAQFILDADFDAFWSSGVIA